MANVYRSQVDSTITVDYTKDSLFRYFEVRVWEQGEDKEEAEIFPAEGLGAGPYTIFLPRSFRRSVGAIWHCEVRTVNVDDQRNAWEGDTDTDPGPLHMAASETEDSYALTDYVTRDGQRELTAAWDAGAWQIRAESFYADKAAGQPYYCDSTTLCVNLNADLLDGQEYSDLQAEFSPIAGSASIVTVGTIASGVWQGTVIDEAYLDADLLNQTEGDARYLMLDCSNDPLTGELVLQRNAAGWVMQIEQQATAAGANSVLFLKGGQDSGDSILLLQDSSANARFQVTADGVVQLPGTLDLGTNTISDGNLTGAWTGVTNLTATGIVQAEHLYSTDDLVVDGLATIGETLKVDGGIQLVYEAGANATFFANAGVGENRYVYVYGDSGGVVKYLRQRIDATGTAIIQSQQSMRILTTGFWLLQTSAAQNAYMDCGGTFTYRDVDDAYANRMTLTSATGDLWLYGDADIDGDLNVDGNAVVDGSLTIGEYLYHQGDADTYLRFQTNDIQMYAGNASVFRLDGNSTCYIKLPSTKWWEFQDSSGNSLFDITESSGDIKIGNDAGSGDNPYVYIYGYDIDAAATKYWRVQVSSAGSTIMESQEKMYLSTGATFAQYFRAGELFYWQDRDASNANRMTLNSATGDLWLYNDADIDGDLNVDGNAVVDGSLTLGEYIYHQGDTDTYLRFTTDQAELWAGGLAGLVLDDNAVSYVRVPASQYFEIQDSSGDAILLIAESTGMLSSDSFTSGVFGDGWRLGVVNSEYAMEVDRLTVRGTLEAFVFKKHIVQASNAMLLVTDSCKLDSDILTSDTVIGVVENTLLANDVVLIQDEIGGNIYREIVTVTSVAGDNLTVVRGVVGVAKAWPGGTVLCRIGNTATAARKGAILLDAGTTHSPFIDILGVEDTSNISSTYTDSVTDNIGKVKVRLGQLSGITDTDVGLSGASEFGMYASNVYLKGRLRATTIDTAASGQRVVIDGTANDITVYNSSDNALFHAAGSGLTLGLSTAEHLKITDSVVEFYGDDGSTVRAQLDGSTWTLGATATEHVQITTTAVSFKDGASTLGSLSGTEWVLGLIASENIKITSTAIQLRDATTVYTDLTAGVLTLGQTASEHVYVSGSALQFKDGASVLGELTGAVWTLGDTSTEHIRITSTAYQVKDGANVYADLTAGAFSLGLTSAEHVLINTLGVSIKDAASVYAKFAATTTVGLTASEHVNITSTAVQLKDGGTVYTELAAGVLTLGLSTAEHLVISDADGLRFYDTDGLTVRGQLTGSDWTLGVTTAEHLKISPTAIQFKDGAAVYTDLAAGVLTLGLSTAEHVVVNTSGITLMDNITTYGQFAATTTIGATATEHVSITSSTMQFKDGATVYTELAAGVLTLGVTTDEYVDISAANGVRFYDDAGAVRGQLSGTAWTLGDTAGEHVSITSAGVYLKDGATYHIQMESALGVRIGQTASEHIDVTATAVKIVDGSTVYTELAAGVLTLGDTSNEHVIVNTSGMTIKDGATQLANYGSTVTIGEVGAGKSNIYITAGEFRVRLNTEARFIVGTDGYVRIYGAGSDTNWLFNTTDNVLLHYSKEATNVIHTADIWRVNNSAGVGGTGLGTEFMFEGECSDGAVREMGSKVVVWTDGDATPSAKYEWYLTNSGAENLAMYLTSEGQLYTDSNTGFDSIGDPDKHRVQLFDEEDDPGLLELYAKRNVGGWHDDREGVSKLVKLGVLVPKPYPHRGYMVDHMTLFQLFAGGIYQNAYRISAAERRVFKLEDQLEAEQEKRMEAEGRATEMSDRLASIEGRLKTLERKAA